MYSSSLSSESGCSTLTRLHAPSSDSRAASKKASRLFLAAAFVAVLRFGGRDHELASEEQQRALSAAGLGRRYLRAVPWSASQRG